MALTEISYRRVVFFSGVHDRVIIEILITVNLMQCDNGVWEMPLLKTDSTNFHEQQRLSDNGWVFEKVFYSFNL